MRNRRKLMRDFYLSYTKLAPNRSHQPAYYMWFRVRQDEDNLMSNTLGEKENYKTFEAVLDFHKKKDLVVSYTNNDSPRLPLSVPNSYSVIRCLL